MRKVEKMYEEKYGDIPRDYLARLDKLIDDANLSRYKINVYDKLHTRVGIKWKTLSFVVYMEPKATPRPRKGFYGNFYVSGASDNKKFFKKYLKSDINLIKTPVKFTCKSYLPIPKSMHPVDKILAEMGLIYPTGKPDWDNVGKAYCDMIQGTLIYDDSLVVEGTSIKRYSSKPRIEITLEYMEDFDSDFNKRKIINKKGG